MFHHLFRGQHESEQHICVFLLPLIAHALHARTSASVSCILLCITAPWQNRRAVDELGQRVHIGELGSRLGAATQSGGQRALNGGSRIFHSPSSPLFSLLAFLYRLIYWETLSALLSKLKDYGFDQLVSQRNWHHLLDEKLGFGGTWLPWRNVRSWLHDGRVGEVADSVSSGSFRGGHWRYLPIRNHDNRSSAD